MNFYENFTANQRVQVGTGHTFDIPAFPDTTGSSGDAQTVAAAMWQHVTEHVPQVASIRADRRYSDIGQAEQIEGLAETAYKRLLGAWHNLTGFEHSINSREKALIGIPEIDKSNMLTMLEEREIREWWGRQDVKTRAEQMRLALEGGDAERIALAILRSPIPQADVEKTQFRKVWEDLRRQADPVEAQRIALGRASIDWAAKNLQYTQVVIKHSTKWDDDRILRHAVTVQDGAFIPQISRLGYHRETIAHAQLRLANRR